VIGNHLWNIASRKVPLTLSGQLILFETLFALLYGFIYKQQLPQPLEIAAMVLLTLGVMWSLRVRWTKIAKPTPASLNSASLPAALARRAAGVQQAVGTQHILYQFQPHQRIFLYQQALLFRHIEAQQFAPAVRHPARIIEPVRRRQLHALARKSASSAANGSG
jgi:hypothetical protein